VQVGQTSLAVGNPLGELGGTVTAGIISALDREILIEGYYVMTLLQTDAAVSPGNSGGGLFNLYGELIGIVNAKSIGVDVDGIGFAIPINSAKKVIDDIITMGYVRGRVSAGLEVFNVSSPREAMMYQVNQTGLYIASSKDGRLHAGDRIVGLNDVVVSDFADFKAALNKYKIGDTVNITVMRGYDRVTVDVTLTELKPQT
jgi:serine protease Do